MCAPGESLQLGEGSGIPSPAAACRGQRAQPGDVVAAGGGGCLDTGPFVPSPTWLLAMRLSCSQILTQRREGKLCGGAGGVEGSQLKLPLRVPPLSSWQQLLRWAGAPGVGAGGLVREALLGTLWQPLLPLPLLCQARLQLLPAEGKPRVGGVGLEGPWCPHWGRPKGTGTTRKCLADGSFSPVPHRMVLCPARPPRGTRTSNGATGATRSSLY